MARLVIEGGVPLRGEEMRQHLHNLADRFEEIAIPAHGRYAEEPAIANADGVQSVPPMRANPRMLFLVATGGAVALSLVVHSRRQ